jgi:hypothetical protein
MLSLSFPGVAIVDTEGGTDFYQGREGVAPFMVLPEKDVTKVMEALNWVEQDRGQTVQTLVIDPITVLWSVLQEAGLQAAQNRARRNNRSADDVSLTQKDWGVIKREWNRLMTRLVNLPCNVIITAREKDIVEQRGTEMITIGKKGDTEKSTPYMADVTVRMTVIKGKDGTMRRVGIIEKDRTGFFKLGQEIENLNFSHFAPALGKQSNSAPLASQRTEEEAAKSAVALFDEEAPKYGGKPTALVPDPDPEDVPFEQEALKVFATPEAEAEMQSKLVAEYAGDAGMKDISYTDAKVKTYVFSEPMLNDLRTARTKAVERVKSRKATADILNS